MPQALVDAWLLKRFPGRTLEDLDSMDWGRLSRALMAAEVDRIEEMLPLVHAGKWKPTADEWRMIRKNDALAGDHL